MPILATAFSILAAAAGVYYLLRPEAAQRLGSYEGQVLNHKRVRLRRIGGAAMLVLGTCFFVGSSRMTEGWPPRAFIAIWAVVMLMLLLIVILAAIDVRLTYRIYHGQRERQD